ncbi:DUF4389 domain-containing protein [Thiohalomonas denitrificans]|uniref:DUF4389 domain-containing protein n=1 Tax=Thiohalomonas denitrificans TaxID=415747 RepID=UPI0026F06231|nr:DUF4389 domain-containing protein [Thiohalomonas denitrificans]
MERSFKKNIRSRGAWLRILYMLLFAMIYGVAEVVLGAVVLFQIGASLITGRANQRLRNFGQQLATYLYEIVLFLTYQSEVKPFPFEPWPDGPPKTRCLPPPAEEIDDMHSESDLDGG